MGLNNIDAFIREVGLDGHDTRWKDDANCLDIDPEFFFPERGMSTRAAKEVCSGCGVRMECLEYALTNGEEHGVWGGMSVRERRRLRQSRGDASRRVVALSGAIPSGI